MARRSVTSFVSRDVGLPPSGAAIADSTARLNLRTSPYAVESTELLSSGRCDQRVSADRKSSSAIVSDRGQQVKKELKRR